MLQIVLEVDIILSDTLCIFFISSDNAFNSFVLRNLSEKGIFDINLVLKRAFYFFFGLDFLLPKWNNTLDLLHGLLFFLAGPVKQIQSIEVETELVSIILAFGWSLANFLLLLFILYLLLHFILKLQIQDQLRFLPNAHIFLNCHSLLVSLYLWKRRYLIILFVLNLNLPVLCYLRFLDKLFGSSMFSVLLPVSSRPCLILTLPKQLLLICQQRRIDFVLLRDRVEQIGYHFGRCSYFHKFLFYRIPHSQSK